MNKPVKKIIIGGLIHILIALYLIITLIIGKQHGYILLIVGVYVVGLYLIIRFIIWAVKTLREK